MVLVFKNIKKIGLDFVIQTKPLVDATELNTLVEDINNTSPGDSTFQKYYRISLDGYKFNDWQSFTIIQNIVADINADLLANSGNNLLSIEFKYTTIQPLGENNLSVNSITIDYDFEQKDSSSEFNQTIFKDFFSEQSVDVAGWYVNLVKKILQKSGILASFLEWDQSNEKDFRQFWEAISKFFSYHVQYARVYQHFYNNKDLLAQFLTQRGLLVTNQQSLQYLQDIMVGYYSEFFSRGTINIIKETEQELGELLRLIQKNPLDEFIFNLRKPQHIGWCLGHSSPCFRTIYHQKNTDKIKIQTITLPPNIQSDKFIIDNKLDYLLYLNALGEGEITLTASFYDVNDLLTVSFSKTFTIERSDVAYPLKVAVYSIYREQSNVNKLDQDSVWGQINIESTSNFTIDNASFAPINTNYSTGFIQLNNWIDCWLRNNNNNYNISDIREIINTYLIPYSSSIKITNIDKSKGKVVLDIDDNQTMWIGGSGYCEVVEWRPINESCETIDVIWEPDEETAYCEKQL